MVEVNNFCLTFGLSRFLSQSNKEERTGGSLTKWIIKYSGRSKTLNLNIRASARVNNYACELLYQEYTIGILRLYPLTQNFFHRGKSFQFSRPSDQRTPVIPSGVKNRALSTGIVVKKRKATKRERERERGESTKKN